MQYGIDIFPYQRINKLNMKKEENSKSKYTTIINGCIYFIIAFLVSRVILTNFIAPFGIAILIAILFNIDKKIYVFPCLGSILGYASLGNSLENTGRYITCIVTISIFNYIFEKVSSKKKILSVLILTLIIFSVYELFFMQHRGGTVFLLTFFETVCIFPIYFIIDYSITCIKNINTKHLFSNEELISMATFISLIIAGTNGFKVYNISITNILALTFILMLSYISGCSIGATCGVAIGAIVGICSGNICMYIGMYALCGLIGGIFRELGKWVIAVGFLVTFCIIVMYSKNIGYFKLVEALVCSTIFLVIPNKFYKKLSLEFDYDRKEKNINENYGDKVKRLFLGRLNNFSGALEEMSSTLINLSGENNLCMKTKSNSLIENLADRVCSKCNMKGICWRREVHTTYSAFEEMIEAYQLGKDEIPKQISEKCINKELIIRNTKLIVDNYVVDELWKKRLSEGRQVLSQQMNNMACSLREIVNEFNDQVQLNIELEKNIIATLNKQNIKFNDVMCLEDKKGRNSIELKMEACKGKQTCVKEILPLINDVTNTNMCVTNDGCNINPNTNECTVVFEQMPKYHISSYVNRRCKDNEEHNGDSYSFGTMSDGSYLLLLSDGMGSGQEAGEESGAVVDLVEKLMNSGFSKETTIDTVNSIMSLKFCEEEKFSTVDLGNIDLYSGRIDFIKVGAAPSFIKKMSGVEVVKSKSLPIGILDKVNVEINTETVSSGEMVIMVSDGMMDYDNEDISDEDWIVEYLNNVKSNNPKEVAEGLINKSIELNNGKVKDDMTVMVSKVYDLY